MRILITGGRVIDPASGLDANLDLLIEDGKIVRMDQNVPGSGFQVPSSGSRVTDKKRGEKGAKNVESASNNADRVMDATGLVVCPGLIDMHVHLR